MRSIGVVTVARSDYGVYRPLLRAIERDADLQLRLFVSGMHLAPRFGNTVQEIESDGYEIAARIEMLLSGDSPSAVASSMGMGAIGFAQAFAASRPDLLFVLGDRFEMHAATVAAAPSLIPVAHFGGGAVTHGAIDDGLRHSITKLSHLHFVETRQHAARVVQMGEPPDRVTVSGALGIDNLANVDWMSLEDLNTRFGMQIDAAPLLVTFHPVTREFHDAESQIRQLLAALAARDEPIVITYPNADTNGAVLIRLIDDFVSHHGNAWAVPNLGVDAYFSLMRHARAMVGNSSSGIIEAASFELPVVNIGNRQAGRLAGRNVIHAKPEQAAITDGIRRAVSATFSDSLRGLKNPYGDGGAARRIVDVLKTVSLDKSLIVKQFHDLESARWEDAA